GAEAGLQPGDTVVSYDGVAITSCDQLSGLIRGSGDQAVPVVVERDGGRVELTVTPVVAERPVTGDAGQAVLHDGGDPATRPGG
ncbi:PDZ domain-containing protein, partial [Cellulomonas sp. GbtcB1]|uniref:PDZ domain-containing protein n=1 Tax=Cellulomonas sp. GbtcB1 TaxID=2824746 RepID=UPI001C30966F